MPQFVLDHGTLESSVKFCALDSFTQGYIEALFFTEEAPGTTAETFDPEVEGSFPGDMSFADLAPAALAEIVSDCARFQAINRIALVDASLRNVNGEAYTDEQAGRDFWFTRNGHGVGYWDRPFERKSGERDNAIGARLSRAAEQFGVVDVYLGDDGKIYIG